MRARVIALRHNIYETTDMRINQSTSLHNIMGAAIKLKGLRCFYCHKHLQLKTSDNLKNRSWNGHLYCTSCYIQASHGMMMENEKSNQSTWFIKKCKSCEKIIGRKYEYCYEHNPYKGVEPREKINIYIKKGKRDTTFGTDNNLRSDLSFCQNINCSDRKPLSKKEMIKVKRRAAGEITMYFCTMSCVSEYTSKNEGLNYRVWR